MPTTPSIAIVGSGFGGIGAAIELKRSGVDSITVLERADGIGGTWRDNTYPGAACDVPSQIYSYSYELNPDWSRRYSSQPEIKGYLEHCARKYGVLDHIRFNTEVEAAAFDEDSGRWTLDLAGGEQLEIDVLITATGQLSRPKIPGVPGVESFAGEQFHSAEWNHDVDLKDKRVAVVGSGASAIQVVPEVAREAGELHVVQRTPAWVAPKHDRAHPRLERFLYRRIPALQRLHHNWLWLVYETRFPFVLRKADAIRPMWERRMKRSIERQVPDPELRAAVTPDYPLGCSRILISNDWYPALVSDHVTLVTAAVERVVPEGLVTEDGRTIEADTVIWCTGFAASEFLTPMRITGRGGRDLHDVWRSRGGADAYLGINVSGFPNLFMLYGPNTNSLTNTIIFLLERQARYIRQALDWVRASGAQWIDVREDVQAEFNEDVERRMQETVFGDGCNTWYKNAAGKVTQNWPGSHTGYARSVRSFEPSAYRVEYPAPALVPAAA